MKRVLLLIFVLAIGYGIKQWPTADQAQTDASAVVTPQITSEPDSAAAVTIASSDVRLQRAFQNRESNLQIAGQGTVIKVLSDDTKGSPHQRFLLRTSTGQTLLVAHNIELAPRIVDIAEGDTVRFYGEYEWNDKGGVIHWTHHDPRGKHVGGWLEHRGQRYE